MDFLSLNIDPIAFTVAGFPVRWYALAYLAGFLLGWKYCLIMVRRLGSSMGYSKPDDVDIDNFISWAVIGVILGGRIGYILFYNFSYYMENPYEILMIQQGGMSFHGGVIGMICAFYAYSFKYKFPVFRLADIVCMAAPIGLFFGRIANFINAELYGRVTSVPWGVVFPGQVEPRHPSQLYEALSEGLVLFVIMFFVSRNNNLKTGALSAVFLLCYGSFRFLVEFFREADVQIGYIFGIISMGQILCMPMIILGCSFLFLAEKGTLARHWSGCARSPVKGA